MKTMEVNSSENIGKFWSSDVELGEEFNLPTRYLWINA